jgi:hypothetical protein
VPGIARQREREDGAVAETDAQKAAGLILGPAGGLAFTALLTPTGCADSSKLLFQCPAGQQADFLGWTLGGLVGRYDNAGIFLVGVFFAVVIYLIVDAFAKKTVDTGPLSGMRR